MYRDEEVSGPEKDEFLISFSRFPSRNSSMSCSSRFYYRSTEGVPFQWEFQPGKPKNPPQKEGIIPPISPPPAVLSLGLQKPVMENSKPQARQWLLGLWKKYSTKLKKQQKVKKVKYCLDEFDRRSGFNNSDSEFMGSPSKSSSSSSSSSTSLSSISFRNDPPLPAAHSSVAESSDRRRLGCSPWNMNRIIVGIGRRV